MSSENQIEQLPENVFPLRAYPPNKNQADDSGNVLYWKPDWGWYVGWFERPHMEGTTHWTYMPPSMPKCKATNDQLRDRMFADWIEKKKMVTPLMVEVAQLGWNAAWQASADY